MNLIENGHYCLLNDLSSSAAMANERCRPDNQDGDETPPSRAGRVSGRMASESSTVGYFRFSAANGN